MTDLSARPDPFDRFAAQRAAEVDPNLDMADFLAERVSLAPQRPPLDTGLIAKLKAMMPATLTIPRVATSKSTSDSSGTAIDAVVSWALQLNRKLAPLLTRLKGNEHPGSDENDAIPLPGIESTEAEPSPTVSHRQLDQFSAKLQQALDAVIERASRLLRKD